MDSPEREMRTTCERCGIALPTPRHPNMRNCRSPECMDSDRAFFAPKAEPVRPVILPSGERRCEVCDDLLHPGAHANRKLCLKPECKVRRTLDNQAFSKLRTKRAKTGEAVMSEPVPCKGCGEMFQYDASLVLPRSRCYTCIPTVGQKNRAIVAALTAESKAEAEAEVKRVRAERAALVRPPSHDDPFGVLDQFDRAKLALAHTAQGAADDLIFVAAQAKYLAENAAKEADQIAAMSVIIKSVDARTKSVNFLIQQIKDLEDKDAKRSTAGAGGTRAEYLEGIMRAVDKVDLTPQQRAQFVQALMDELPKEPGDVRPDERAKFMAGRERNANVGVIEDLDCTSCGEQFQRTRGTGRLRTKCFTCSPSKAKVIDIDEEGDEDGD